MSIQWFPGHMAKTRRMITDNLKLIDVVVELADARLPESSRNPLLSELIGQKPRVLVLTKADLAQRELTNQWLMYYKQQEIPAIALNLTRSTKNNRKEFLDLVRGQAREILEKRAKKGIINKTVRTMIIGIPNVGKSTLINMVAGRGAAETGNRPGVTRGKQWIRLENDVELLDTPGMLWPKIEDPEVGRKLAATGAVSDNTFDQEELAIWLLEWLQKNLSGRINERYKVPEEGSGFELLEVISRKRGFLRSGGIVDPVQGAIMLLDEFRAGKLGYITLDRDIDL